MAAARFGLHHEYTNAHLHRLNFPIESSLHLNIFRHNGNICSFVAQLVGCRRLGHQDIGL